MMHIVYSFLSDSLHILFSISSSYYVLYIFMNHNELNMASIEMQLHEKIG